MDDRGDWHYEDCDELETFDETEEQELELETVCLRDFVREELPERRNVLDPILPERGLAMLFAARGIGKTHVALGIAYAVSTGGSFLRWQAERPRDVLYVDGEMPQQALQERLRAIMDGSERRLHGDAFRLLCMDRQPLGTALNLASRKCQKLIGAHLDGVELLVLDNLSTLVNGGPENDAESWIAMQEWLLDLRRRGITVLIVHHAGRAGNARGTSKREDVLDTVIQLKSPPDYDVSDGARFEVHLTKARGVFGEDALPFEAKLRLDDEGRAEWVCSDLGSGDEHDLEAALALKQSGKSTREIARELQMSKSAVHRLLQRGGRLDTQAIAGNA
jgi:hypothetical protein